MQCLIFREIVCSLGWVGGELMNVPTLHIVLLVPFRKWKCFLLFVAVSDLKDGKKATSYLASFLSCAEGELQTSGLKLCSFLFLLSCSAPTSSWLWHMVRHVQWRKHFKYLPWLSNNKTLKAGMPVGLWEAKVISTSTCPWIPLQPFYGIVALFKQEQWNQPRPGWDLPCWYSKLGGSPLCREVVGPAAGWASQLLGGTLLETLCIYQAPQPTIPAVWQHSPSPVLEGEAEGMVTQLWKEASEQEAVVCPAPDAGRRRQSRGGKGDQCCMGDPNRAEEWKGNGRKWSEPVRRDSSQKLAVYVGVWSRAVPGNNSKKATWVVMQSRRKGTWRYSRCGKKWVHVPFPSCALSQV